MSKVSSGPKCTGQRSSGIKHFGLTNENSKSLAEMGGLMCGRDLVKKKCNSL